MKLFDVVDVSTCFYKNSFRVRELSLRTKVKWPVFGSAGVPNYAWTQEVQHLSSKHFTDRSKHALFSHTTDRQRISSLEIGKQRQYMHKFTPPERWEVRKNKENERKTYPCTLCPGHESLPNVAHTEHRRGLDVIPILLGEGVDAVQTKRIQTHHQQMQKKRSNWPEKDLKNRQANSRLLLPTLLSLGDPLVLADCHGCRRVRSPWPLPRGLALAAGCKVDGAGEIEKIGLAAVREEWASGGREI